MNTEELKKLLKDNRVHFYSYWDKNKLIDLAKINKLIPEPEEPEKTKEPKEPEEPEKTKEPKEPEEPEKTKEPEEPKEPKQKPKTSKRPDYKRMRKIRNEPISVKFIDIKTKEKKNISIDL